MVSNGNKFLVTRRCDGEKSCDNKYVAKKLLIPNATEENSQF